MKNRPSAGYSSPKLRDEQSSVLERLPEYIIITMIVAVTLIILPDINDSTALKPYVFYCGTVTLLLFGGYNFMQSRSVEIRLSFGHIAMVSVIFAGILSGMYAYNIREWGIDIAFHGLLVVAGLSSSIVFARETSEKRLWKLLMILCWLVCFFGLLQALDAVPFNLRILASGRDVIGTLGNATYFAGFLILMIPIVLALISNAKQRTERLTLIVLFGIMLFLLVRTETRSAWFAGVAGIFVFTLLNFRNKTVRYASLGLMVAGILLVGLVSQDIILHRLTGMFEMNKGSSFSRRLFFYEGAWKAFLDSPIFGNGAGNFSVFLPKFRSPDYWVYGSEDIVPHAHNEFLEIASETGIVGIIAFLFLLISIGQSVRKVISTVRNDRRTMLIGYVASIIAVLIDNLFSLNLRTIPVAMCFWVILGIMIGYGNENYRAISVTLPSWVRSLRWLPLILLPVLLTWIINKGYIVYNLEMSVIEGNIATWKNNDSQALEKFKKAVDIDPSNALARYSLAANYLKQNNHKAAFHHVSKLLEGYPYYPKSYLISSIALGKIKGDDAAIDEIKKEIQIENSPQPYYYYAYFVGNKGDTPLERTVLLTLLQRCIAGRTLDFAVESIERLRFICTDDESKKECAGLVKQLLELFPDNIKLQTASAECYAAFRMITETERIVGVLGTLSVLPPDIQGRIQQLQKYLLYVKENSRNK